MAIKRIQCGPRMSQAVVHGNLVYISGQVANDPAATTVKAQTAILLQQIESLLAGAGARKEHLLSATIWLADIETFAEMNEVWERWAAPGAAPARATVEARLAGPQFLVEIAAIAATA